jgi:parallel beta-helix repeat protein
MRPAKKSVRRRNKFARPRMHSKTNRWLPYGISAIAAAAAFMLIYNWLNLGTNKNLAAELIALSGSVELVRETASAPAQVGTQVIPGEGLKTGAGGLAKLRYPDGTTIELKEESNLSLLRHEQAKRLALKQGEIFADVAKQKPDEALTVVTPHGEATVVGTQLKLAVAKESTRLEVTQGKVRLTNPDNKFVDVEAGNYAVATAGVELRSQALPVIIQPGQSIQQAIDTNPGETRFVLKAGIYRLQNLSPKQGDVFEGESGTILNGAKLLTTFAREGKYWVAVDQRQQGQVRGESATGYPGAVYPEDLLVDDQPLVHVTHLADVVPGKWFFDYDAHRIYLGDDPAGRKVETSAAPVAFSGNAANVTLRNLVIEKYACPAQVGAIGGDLCVLPTVGPGWLIENCELRLNHGSGISMSHGWIVRNCKIVHNGQLGIRGSGDDMVVENNDMAFNNFAHFNLSWEAGGLKIMISRNTVIRNNRVFNNDGAGLLTDIDTVNTLYEGNTVADNIVGIAHYASGKAVIRNNIVRNNGKGDSPWLWGAQINLRNSRDVDISHNTVEVAADGGNGITIIQQKLNSGSFGPHVSVNNFCHENEITMYGQNGLNGAAADYDKDTMLNGNNRFDANHYHVTNKDAQHWNWQDPKTWQEFCAAGHEAHGTVDENFPPSELRNTRRSP